MNRSRLRSKVNNNNNESEASTSKMNEFINPVILPFSKEEMEKDYNKSNDDIKFVSEINAQTYLTKTFDNDEDKFINQPTTFISDSTKHPFYFKLLEIFPNICPSYLKEFCSNTTKFEKIDDFINDLLNENYPTKEEYLKKKKLLAQEKQYTTEFHVKKFLEVIPDPEAFFEDPKRQVSFNNFDDSNYAITFLKNHFNQKAIKDILHSFKISNSSVINTANILENVGNMKTKRKLYTVTRCTNIRLLQEIAYVTHKNEILDFIKYQKLEKQKAREEARAAGLLRTCLCCYDDEVIPNETVFCESGKHEFCKMCVRKGCEVAIGKGKLYFTCFEDCESFFTLQVLQTVLDPKVFSKIVERKQIEEVKSANIEDLEFCSFCNFAIILAPNDTIFQCLNPDCMKKTCRLCKKLSHVPLRCEEVEKDTEIKIRTDIEDKMTEALLRKCYKCGMKFVKESGCNKITCHCGAIMCYLCQMPVKDYTHFNGPGGDQHHLCQLFTDTNGTPICNKKKRTRNQPKALKKFKN